MRDVFSWQNLVGSRQLAVFEEVKMFFSGFEMFVAGDYAESAAGCGKLIAGVGATAGEGSAIGLLSNRSSWLDLGRGSNSGRIISG
jgi:hypothetical protein